MILGGLAKTIPTRGTEGDEARAFLREAQQRHPRISGSIST